jgi:cold shock CspA family protein
MPDPGTRLLGTVAAYSKFKGFGFIDVTQKGVVPGDCVFVHWRAIQSKDRFPFLVVGSEVEFSVENARERRGPARGTAKLNAAFVTFPGGEAIAVQDASDAQSKTFIGGQAVRYTGTLKFFETQAGFGYITVDSGFQPVDGVEIPHEVRVERVEVNCGNENPSPMQNIAVEFGLWRTSRGSYQAYNMTLPGGVIISQAALEHRQSVLGERYFGEIVVWNWQKLWGFIKCDDSVPLPPHVQARLTQQTEEAIKKAQNSGKNCSKDELLYFRKRDVKSDTGVRKGMRVSFMLYVDDRGAGASDIMEV